MADWPRRADAWESLSSLRGSSWPKPEQLCFPQVYTDWNKRREVAAWLSAHPSHTPEGWPDATQPPADTPGTAAAAAATRRRQAGRIIPGLGRAPPLHCCAVALVVAVALGGGLASSLGASSLDTKSTCRVLSLVLLRVFLRWLWRWLYTE